MLKAFRVTRVTRVATSFSGAGAAMYGGRWNSPGTKVVYTSATLSLAMVEILAHLDDFSTLSKGYVFIPIEIPSELITNLDDSDLPVDWNSPTLSSEAQKVGDLWVSEQKSAVLSVPTVIAPGERNYLLNPQHPEFTRIVIGNAQSLSFDPRLTK